MIKTNFKYDQTSKDVATTVKVSTSIGSKFIPSDGFGSIIENKNKNKNKKKMYFT